MIGKVDGQRYHAYTFFGVGPVVHFLGDVVLGNTLAQNGIPWH
jgi:hypothetical protein